MQELSYEPLRGRCLLICAVLIIIAAPETAAFSTSATYVTGEIQKYTVASGDALYTIARGHGLAFPAVARANNIVDPNIVRLGRVLILPTRFILPAVRDEGIVINLPEYRLFVFRGGVVNAVYPVTIGLPTWRTPIGSFEIINRVQNPAWYMPPELAQRENIKREIILPGSDNPLGDFWIGTSIKHTGLHSTNSPMTIGRALSHGCIRLYPEHAKVLFGETKIGDTGEIVYMPVKVAIDRDDVLVEIHPDVYGLIPDLGRLAEEELRAIGAWEKIDPTLLRRAVSEARGIPVTVRASQDAGRNE